jgi:single-stranded-DNA-specific exonuclease
LLEAGGRRLEQATASDLGFVAGPRLNAAGRLTDMSVGIECLLADDPAEAARLAGQLSALNAERRDIEQRMQLEAVDIAAALRFDVAGGESPGLCLFDESWHQGVVGLVAGRIKDRLHRPVIAFARSETGGLRGSARSVPGIHIRDALDSIAARHPGLIDKFGGHAMAAGMSLAEEALDRFRAAFESEIAARADAGSLRGIIHSDGELGHAELCIDTARLLRGAGPWGQGFPEPAFDGEFEILELRIVGGRHLKMSVRDSMADRAGPHIDAIAFGYIGGAGEDPRLRAGMRAHLAYRLEVNEFRGVDRVQLNCQQVRRVPDTPYPGRPGLVC